MCRLQKLTNMTSWAGSANFGVFRPGLATLCVPLRFSASLCVLLKREPSWPETENRRETQRNTGKRSAHSKVLKESSDELNPEFGATDPVPRHQPPRTLLDYVALALATFGVGYLPIAPGTLGSLVGVLIFLAARRMALLYGIDDLILEASLIIVITLLGIWAASQ